MLSDANAEIDRFQSPYSGNSIFAHQLHGATIGLKDFVNPGLGFAALRPLSDYELSGAPSGLTISSRTVNTEDDELFLTFSCIGSCRTVSSNTSVTIRVRNTAYIPSERQHTSNWYDEGTFTIKPTVAGLVTSTPTNSSTVTEAGSQSTFTVRLRSAPSANVTVAVSSDDTTEGSVSPNMLTFTTQNYATAQTVTVTGVDDVAQDGNVNWNVVLNPSSTDTTYNTLSNVNVAMTTTDDDAPSFSIDSPSVTEGDSGLVNLVFTVTLSRNGGTLSSYSVRWRVTGGTATSGTDYTAITGGTRTFNTGETSKTITVQVRGDTLVEGNETVVITLSSPSFTSTIGTAIGTGTITEDDTPTFTIDSPSVTEGDSGLVNLVFTVTLSRNGGTLSSYSVRWRVTGGTATSGTDYTAITGGTRTFNTGETSKTITVQVRGDTDFESDETVVVTLSSPSFTSIIGTAIGTGTITDDDTPRFSINSPSVAEGDSSTTSLTFTVTLSPASATQVAVNYASSDGTTNGATAGTDYTAVNGTLTFAANQTSRTITVSVTGDTTYESDETVVVTLSGASSGTNISMATGTGTITNDDPGLSIDSPSVTEGDSGSVNLVFTVTLAPTSSSQVTVNYARSGGTATSGTDFTALAASTTLTFAANETSKTITVLVTGDTVIETDETVIITLSSPSGAGIATASGTGTIRDNDTPRFSIDSPSATEGDSGSANLTFTVTLSPAATSTTTVNYADAGTGTATSGTDYTALAASNTLTFAANETSKTITVTVTGDTLDEGADETVVLTLSNSSAGTGISTASGTGTIRDNDPKFSINSPTVTEGDSGSVNLTFTVTLGASSISQYTVDYADAGTGTATSGTDYTSVTASTLTFASGVTSRTIEVPVTGDMVSEANETVVLMLSNATGGAGIATASGTGTITDNETSNFSINSPSVTEGNSGSVNLVFTVTLSPALAATATVNYARTGGTATSGTDYTALANGMLTFAANETSKTITVSVTGDTDMEQDETVIIMLSSPSGANIATASGTGMIRDDDTPRFSIDSPSLAEGDSGSVNLVFTVTLMPTSSSQVTVDYAQTGGTAVSGTDYTAVTASMLTFAAGDTSKTITVLVTGDTDIELDETVVIMLSNASTGARIATASGTGTILDDDTPAPPVALAPPDTSSPPVAPETPGFSIDSPSVTEGDSGSVNLTFTVSLSPASDRQVTVNYADAGTGTATSGTDYTALAASNTLTFVVGDTNKTITVSVSGDTMYEPDETVVLMLSDASAGTNITTASGTGTIENDDATPVFSIDSPSVTEGDSGLVNLTFTVSLSPASDRQVTVNYADAGTGTATSGTDYTALVASNTLTFAVGDTNKTITVSVSGDTMYESDETVVLMLSDASAGTNITTASGTGTIENDDATPVFSIDSPSVEEVDTGSVKLIFTVTLTPASYEQATVNYADAGTGTATSGTDYTALAASNTLTFAAGETSKKIDVSVLGDVLSEQDETIVLVLSNPNPSTYTIEEVRGTGTITDNNDASVLDEVDTEIVVEVAREITTSVVTAVGNRIASVVGGAAIVPPTGGFADGGLLSILERTARHSREREHSLERSEMSLYRSLDGASFIYSPGVVALGANGTADASGGMLTGTPTVWGSVDYRKMSGGGADALQWDGELASVNVGTDTMVDAGVLVGLAAGMSKGSFGYRGSTSGVVKVSVKTVNPYIGWSVSESASLWAAIGYGKGKVNYNDGATGEAASKMSIASAALGGRYRLHSNDGSSDGRLIQVDLKGEAWGLQTKVDGDERRPMGSKSQAHGVRVAIERLQSSALESGASLTLSGETGLRWDGGDGDTGTGIEMGGTADYRNPATRMKVVATGRALLDHESDRKEWGAGLTAGYRLESRETGLTYSSSLSRGQTESGVDSLWDSSVASRASEDEELTTRLYAEVGYRMFGPSGLHTPYVGFGLEEGSKRDYRIGMRYASESELSSGLEFERREADNKRPDHRVMLTGQIDW